MVAGRQIGAQGPPVACGPPVMHRWFSDFITFDHLVTTIKFSTAFLRQRHCHPARQLPGGTRHRSVGLPCATAGLIFLIDYIVISICNVLIN